jgi:hypothetical protein
MKRIRLFAVVAAVGLSSVFGVAAAIAPAAGAAARAPVHVSAPKTVVVPLRADIAITDCAYHSGYFTTWYGSCTSYINWYCTHGNGSSINPPSYVSNDCATRVWLYQYTSHTGYTLCISPYSRTGYLQRTYKAFWVSSNYSGC